MLALPMQVRYHALGCPFVGLAFCVHLRSWIHRILRTVGTQADGGDQRPLDIVGTVEAGLGRKEPTVFDFSSRVDLVIVEAPWYLLISDLLC
jgi:hypothetical protein